MFDAEQLKGVGFNDLTIGTFKRRSIGGSKFILALSFTFSREDRKKLKEFAEFFEEHFGDNWFYMCYVGQASNGDFMLNFYYGDKATKQKIAMVLPHYTIYDIQGSKDYLYKSVRFITDVIMGKGDQDETHVQI